MSTPLLEPGTPGCWNSIGVWRREHPPCPRLSEFAHCRNCPAFSSVARQVLGQPLPDDIITEEFDSNPAESIQESDQPVYILRLGEQLIALPSACVRGITEVATILPIPNRESTCLRGLVNLDGSLRVVVSLGSLLQIPRASGNNNESRQTSYERLVQVRHRRQDWVFPVSEVLGRYHLSQQQITQTAEQSAVNSLNHVQAVVDWGKHKVMLLSLPALDEDMATLVKT